MDVQLSPEDEQEHGAIVRQVAAEHGFPIPDWSPSRAWEVAQEHEAAFWGNCVNTYQEEAKQIDVAQRLGLEAISLDGHWPVYDLAGKTVIDIGGGPVSLLLKTVNGGRLAVIDPAPFPDWVYARYQAAGIGVYDEPAEQLTIDGWDEAWIYNTLQHVKDPQLVIEAAKRVARRLRIFEWIEVERDPWHPHVVRAEQLNAWLADTDGEATREWMPRFGGTAYYGVFLTKQDERKPTGSSPVRKDGET